MEIKTNICYFNKNNGEIVKLKDCSILREFMYNRNNFTIIEKNNIYWVCVLGEKDELYSIWSRNKNDESTPHLNSVLSLFRKEYDRNGITNDLINKFLKNPLKTTLLKIKKGRKKKK
jgi:hypothetical protein